MKKLCAIICALSTVFAMQAQDYSKILMLGTPSATAMQTNNGVDDDEDAAYVWFMGHEGATYASASDVASGNVSLYNYSAVWVVLDRVLYEGTAEAFANNLRNANDALFSSEVIAKLADYYKDGGNFLLTNHASILLKEMGRYGKYPLTLGGFNSAGPEDNGDIWYARTSYLNDTDPVNNKSNDPLYTGISIQKEGNYWRFPYTDSNPRENHNCFFNLDVDGNDNGSTEKYTKLATQFGVEYLAVWPHITDICSAAITRWNPFGEFAGKSIAIGFGGFEWHPNSGTNTYQYNIERLTENALAELSAGNPPTPPTPPTPIEDGTMLLHYDMDKQPGFITETVNGEQCTVHGHHSEAMPGAINDGTALRLDAYSTYVEGNPAGSMLLNKLTIDLWCAAETYPMGSIDHSTEGWATIAGNELDGNGWKWELSSRGNYRFYAKLHDQPAITLNAPAKFPKYVWAHLVAAIDAENGTVEIYNNGELLASAACPTGFINLGTGSMIIGKSRNSAEHLGCLVNSFNGLIDDITLYSGVNMVETLNALSPQHNAELIVSTDRYAGSIHRPQLHAAPGANWGNEPTGIYYDPYNYKFHMFYQKNANGQYLSHMHWGHLVSYDLFNWTEVRTAIEPSEDYDWKGCWSGCIFQDPDFNNGYPTIFYTGVNDADPYIIEALPLDGELLTWSKNPTGISRPASGYDFRDPYVFKHGGNFYMIIGCANDGHGALRLHTYDAASGKWSITPPIFFEANNEGPLRQGAFWEMPSLTCIDGQWLLIVTTCAVAEDDVRAIYWIGDLEGSGSSLRFVPSEPAPRMVEMDGLAGYGYGLLSPSILQKDGLTAAIGIVPDKLTPDKNRDNGWSHNYSLPRLWSIQDNRLVQSPLSPYNLRVDDTKKSLSHNNTPEEIDQTSIKLPSGRMLDIDFAIDSEATGTYTLEFFKGTDSHAELSYNAATGELRLNTQPLNRMMFDSDRFANGFSTTIPGALTRDYDPAATSIRAIIDHSNVDVFVNGTYASSMRVYPLNEADDDVQLTTTETGHLNNVYAFALDPKAMEGVVTGIDPLTKGNGENVVITYGAGALTVAGLAHDAALGIYTTTGQFRYSARLNAGTSTLPLSLPAGLYIVTLPQKTAKIMIR